MGLIRCPKCDAICHTEEETCHYCGYRLKPETKKEEPIFDSNPIEAEIETEEDPFAAFGYKEDPFEDFDKQVESKEKPKQVKETAKSETFTTTKENGEPSWIAEYKNKSKRAGKISIFFSFVFGVLFAVFLILLFEDQDVTHYDAVTYQGITIMEAETFSFPKTEYMVLVPIFGFSLFMSVIFAFVYAFHTYYVKRIDGYYVLVSHCSGTWELIIENNKVDHYFRGRYNIGYGITLSGLLPNGKTLMVNIRLDTYDIKPTFEVIDGQRKTV